MKRGIIGAVLGAATVAAVLVVGPGGMASATPDQESEVCYEQVPYTVYQYSKTTTTPAVEEVSHLEYSYSKEVRTETFKTQYEVDKYVRDRTRESGNWYTYNPGKDKGDDDPFTGPINKDNGWQSDNGNHNGLPQDIIDTVFQNGGGHGSYFYHSAAGAWSEWSTPTRWPGNTHLAWVDVVPAENWQKHGDVDTDTYQRQWTVYATGNTKQVSTGFTTETVFSGVVKEPLGDPWTLLNGYPVKVVDQEFIPGFDTTVFYNDGNVGPTDLAVDGARNPGWTTDQTLDRSWKQIRTDVFEKDGKQIPCSEQPKDKTTKTKWSDGEYDCGDTTVEQTRTKTVTPYILDDNYEWVLDTENAVVTEQTRTRDLSEEEQTTCPIKAIPVDPTVTDPTCDAPGAVVLPDETVGYDWVKQADGTYKAVADPGYYLDPAERSFDPGDLSQTTGGVCADVQSASPVPAEVQVEVASQSPVVVPAAAPTTQAAVVAATPTQLPSTGSSSWVAALIALVTLLGGTALVRLSRRQTD